MARTHPWEVSDEWWRKVQPLIPPAPSHAKGGRPRKDDRRAFAAIIYVLRTGIQWNALPKDLGASQPFGLAGHL
jgi:putative transposase